MPHTHTHTSAHFLVLVIIMIQAAESQSGESCCRLVALSLQLVMKSVQMTFTQTDLVRIHASHSFRNICRHFLVTIPVTFEYFLTKLALRFFLR